jgi:hypothetical protein
VIKPWSFSLDPLLSRFCSGLFSCLPSPPPELTSMVSEDDQHPCWNMLRLCANQRPRATGRHTSLHALLRNITYKPPHTRPMTRRRPGRGGCPSGRCAQRGGRESAHSQQLSGDHRQQQVRAGACASVLLIAAQEVMGG